MPAMPAPRTRPRLVADEIGSAPRNTQRPRRYRCGLVEVEAHQWTGVRDPAKTPAWLEEAEQAGIVALCPNSINSLLIQQPGRCETIEPGDWLVREASGEIVACKAFLFRYAFRPL